MSFSVLHRKLYTALQWVILMLLVVVVAVTLYFCVRNFETLRLRGNIRPMHNRHQVFTSPEEIQSWMTFRYINLVFHLPADYLKTSLGITDPHYPNLSINTLGRQQHQTANAQLQKVIAAIKNQR